MKKKTRNETKKMHLKKELMMKLLHCECLHTLPASVHIASTKKKEESESAFHSRTIHKQEMKMQNKVLHWKVRSNKNWRRHIVLHHWARTMKTTIRERRTLTNKEALFEWTRNSMETWHKHFTISCFRLWQRHKKPKKKFVALGYSKGTESGKQEKENKR